MKRRRRTWTAKDVRTLKKLANKRMRAATIAQTLKRTEGGDAARVLQCSDKKNGLN